jgi:hypothetical protein
MLVEEASYYNVLQETFISAHFKAYTWYYNVMTTMIGYFRHGN